MISHNGVVAERRDDARVVDSREPRQSREIKVIVVTNFPRIPENVSTWLVDWTLVTVMANTMPPRNPNDDDDEDEEDEEDEDRHEEPPVVREPDE
jgi:hypothetical protein